MYYSTMLAKETMTINRRSTFNWQQRLFCEIPPPSCCFYYEHVHMYLSTGYNLMNFTSTSRVVFHRFRFPSFEEGIMESHVLMTLWFWQKSSSHTYMQEVGWWSRYPYSPEMMSMQWWWKSTNVTSPHAPLSLSLSQVHKKKIQKGTHNWPHKRSTKNFA